MMELQWLILTSPEDGEILPVLSSDIGWMALEDYSETGAQIRAMLDWLAANPDKATVCVEDLKKPGKTYFDRVSEFREKANPQVGDFLEQRGTGPRSELRIIAISPGAMHFVLEDNQRVTFGMIESGLWMFWKNQESEPARDETRDRKHKCTSGKHVYSEHCPGCNPKETPALVDMDGEALEVGDLIQRQQTGLVCKILEINLGEVQLSILTRPVLYRFIKSEWRKCDPPKGEEGGG